MEYPDCYSDYNNSKWLIQVEYSSKIKKEYRREVGNKCSYINQWYFFPVYILYKRKYSIDDNYFSKIDNQNKAYILGFMYADGAVYPRRAKLDLQIDDLYILEQIQKEMNIEMPIKIYKNQKTWFYDK